MNQFKAITQRDISFVLQQEKKLQLKTASRFLRCTRVDVLYDICFFSRFMRRYFPGVDTPASGACATDAFREPRNAKQTGRDEPD